MKIKTLTFSILIGLAASTAFAEDRYVVRVPFNATSSSLAEGVPEAGAPEDPVSISLSAAELPAGTVGVPYGENQSGFDLTPLLNVTPSIYSLNDISWGIESGQLPAGIFLGADGRLVGTPTVKNEAGATFGVSASYRGADSQQLYTIVVNESIFVVLNTDTLPSGKVRTPYSFNLNTLLDVQGDPDFSAQDVAWSVVDGALPQGLALQADGTLAGTPTVSSPAGTSFTVMASYKGREGQQGYSIVVDIATVTVASLPASRTKDPVLDSLLNVTNDLARGAQSVLRLYGDKYDTVILTDTSATALDLLQVAQALPLDTVDVGSVKSLSGSAKELRTLYQAIDSGRLLGLGNETVTVSFVSTASAADLNAINAATSGRVTVSSTVTSLTGSASELLELYAATGASAMYKVIGLGNEDLTVTGDSATASQLLALENATSGTVTVTP